MADKSDQQQAPAEPDVVEGVVDRVVDTVDTVVDQLPGVDERTDRSRLLATAVFVLLLAVPAAFVAGWRMGRSLGRLTGYYGLSGPS